MHIFNRNNQSYLIITAQKILFRHHETDLELRPYNLIDIKKISLIHRYDASGELFIFLQIQFKEQHTPLIIQISFLDTKPEEILALFKEELTGKVSLHLPQTSFIQQLQTRHKNQKIIIISFLLAMIGLFYFHKSTPPDFMPLKETALEAQRLKNTGLCSSRAKVALNTKRKDELVLIHYCGILGTWQEESRKTLEKTYLKTEFSDKTYTDYILTTKKAFKAKDYNTSIINVKQAIYLKPKDEHAYTLLSYAQFYNKEIPEAFTNVQKALKLAPNYKQAHEAIAFFYQEQNELKKAYPHYKRSCELEPSAKTYIKLAEIDKKFGDPEAALNHFEKSLALDSKNAYVWTELGLLYWKKKAYAKTKTSLQNAYLLFPDNPFYFLNYYEATLVVPSDVTITEHKHFLSQHKNNIQSVMTYDMLKIIELSIKNLKTEKAKQQWYKQYKNQALHWSFYEIRNWLDASDLEIEHKQKVQSTIGFFIAYQQAYKIKHPSLNTVNLPQPSL